MIRYFFVAILFTAVPSISAELLFEDENVVEIFQSQDFESNLVKAQQGDARSQYLVGAAYLRGLEDQKVEMDPDKGIFWLKKSAEQGAGEAYDGLAVVYREGLGVEPDIKKWQEYLAKAAELGVIDALLEIKKLYRDGDPERGIEKNAEKYLYWLKKSAERGSAFSMVNMAITYRQGLGVDKDLGQSFEWLKRAVEQDDLSALGMMGEYYEKGMVVEQDLVTAYMMYDLSGSTPNKAREKLAEKMTEAQIKEAIARSWQWQVERASYRPTSKGYSYRYPIEKSD